jgi:predicted phage terminase large subunit-like protein
MPVVAKNSSADLMNQMRAATEAARRRLSPARKYGPADEHRRWLQQVTPQWTWTWPHQLLVDKYLNRVTRGECKRLMLFMPPRHTKTEKVTVRYPAWRLEKNPELRVILGAYNQDLANKFSRKMRRIVESRLNLSRDLKQVKEWELPEGGGVRAAGVKSGITGYGADLVMIDDPIKSRAEAESKTYRKRVIDWYTDDLYSRLEPNAAIVLTMTRWHTDDLAGWLLQEAENGGEQWEVLSLPALAEDDDPLGREPGEALCPARYDQEALLRIKDTRSAQSWSSLYQQNPIASEGTVFDVDWFTRIEERAPEGLRWARYWDLAASTKTSADYTCSAAVAFGKDGTLYIRDMIRDRMEWPDARQLIIKTMKAEPRTRHGVEEALHGLAAVQELRRERSIVNVPFRGVRVTKDKLSRALAWSERAATGKVVLIADTKKKWIKAFLDEAAIFTGEGDTHDDQIDSISGGVEMLAKPGGRIHAW